MITYDPAKCNCTPAYYCPDENQWEPPHMCDYCEEYEHAVYDESGVYPSVPVVQVSDEDEIDDLPF